MKNKLIVIEGCDGSGKSSISLKLAKKIGGIYYKTPSKIFWEMRHEIEETKDFNLIFYFYLTGTLHASHEISKILEKKHVVCDRYFYTTLAYHKCLGVDIPKNLEKLFIKPDYSFCLYADKETIEKRLKKRVILGPHDLNVDLQNRAFEELKNFGLELFDTSNFSVNQSVIKLLNRIEF